MSLRHWGCIVSLLAILAGCNPFKGSSSAEGGGSGWPDTIADIAGSVLLDADKGMLFHGYDTLTYPETETELRVLVQRISRMSSVPGLTVTFYDDDDEIGSAITNSDGIAMLPFTPPEEGDYAFTARITEVANGANEDILDIDPTPILVVARTAEAKFLVVDLDHTVVKDGFQKVLTSNPKPMSDAKDVLERMQDELDYNVIYLTHRPALMTRKSKEWIVDQGLPTGPLLASKISDITDNEGYKATQIATLKERFPDIRIGVGDKVGDAKAYLSNDLAAFLLPYVKDGADSKDLYELANEIDNLPEGELYVVEDWREIEVAIFNNIPCPAKTYTTRLRLRADRLAEKEKRDDDDDDDNDDDDD